MVPGEDHPLDLPTAQQPNDGSLHAAASMQQQCYTTLSGGGASTHTGCESTGAEATASDPSQQGAGSLLPTLESRVSSHSAPPSGGFGAVGSRAAPQGALSATPSAVAMVMYHPSVGYYTPANASAFRAYDAPLPMQRLPLAPLTEGRAACAAEQGMCSHARLTVNHPPPPDSVMTWSSAPSSASARSRASTRVAPEDRVRGEAESEERASYGDEEDDSSDQGSDGELPYPAGEGEAAHPIKKFGKAIFTSKELTSMQLTCEPDEITAWSTTFKSRLFTRSSRAYSALLMSDAQWLSLTPSQLRKARAADAAVAGELLACVSKSTDRGKLIHKNIARAEKRKPGSAANSGRAIWAEIQAIVTPSVGPDVETLELELAKPFFKDGMTVTQVELAAGRLDELRSQLPPTSRGGERERLRALLAKFPSSQQAEASRLKKKMQDREARKLPYKWTYDELTRMLAMRMVGAAAEAREKREANAAEERRAKEVNAAKFRDDSNGGKSERERERERGETGNAIGCLNCGSKEHKYKDCEARCKQVIKGVVCGLKGCGGCYKPKPECAVARGGYADDAKGADGRLIPDMVKKRVAKRVAAIKAGEANATTQTATPSTNDGAAGESDHVDGICCAADLGGDECGGEANLVTWETGELAEGCVPVLIDRGSSLSVLNSDAASIVRASELVDGTQSSIVGIAKGATTAVLGEYRLSGEIVAVDGREPQATIPLSYTAHYAPDSRRSVVCEAELWDRHLLSVVAEPDMLIKQYEKRPDGSFVPTGRTVPVVRKGNLYFFGLRLRECAAAETAVEPSSSVAALPPMPGSFPSTKSQMLAALWAARLHGKVKCLRLAAKSTVGSDVPSELSSAMMRSIESDHIRDGANARRPFVPSAERSRSSVVGYRLILDDYGEIAAKDIVDGVSNKIKVAVDEASDFCFQAPARESTVASWVTFVVGVRAYLSKCSHELRVVRVDAVPALSHASFDDALAKYGISVERAARGAHESLKSCEAAQDPLTRIAEAMLQRAERGLSYFIRARLAAGFVRNRKCKRGSLITRYEAVHGQPPNLSKPVPYLFATTVSVLDDSNARGVAGTPRSWLGELVGFGTVGHGSSGYLVQPFANGTTRPQGKALHCRDVEPIDEEKLVRRGHMSSQSYSSTACGTDRGASSNRARDGHEAEAERRARQTGVPIGGDVGDRNVRADHVGRPATRLRSSVQREAHECDTCEHACANDALGSPAPSAVKALELLGRSRSDHEYPPHFAGTLETMLERHHSSADADATVEMVNHVLRGGAPMPGFDVKCGEAMSTEIDGHDPEHECHKATQGAVAIQEDIGVRLMHVPATVKQLMKAPDREEWLAADQLALDVLLAVPGNKLIAVEDAVANGMPIYESVTQRRLKVDQDTGRLASKNGRKSRICANGSPSTRAGKAMREGADRPAYATQADEGCTMAFLSDVNKRDRDMTQGDVGHAYTKGEREGPTPRRALRIPRHLVIRDERGREMCIELGPPTWGEHDSGMWWGRTFDTIIVAMGWQPAEGVPCLYYFVGEGGTANMLTKTDDFLISEDKSSCKAITNKTFAALEKAGLTCVRTDAVASVDGMAIERDRSKRELRVSMPQKAQEMIDALEPGYGGTGDDTVDALPASQADLKEIVDHLMARRGETTGDVERSAAHKAQVHQVQVAAGYFRFLRRVHPAITVALHRLSCCALDPPPAAMRIIKSIRRYIARRKYHGIVFGRSAGASAGLSASLYADVKLEEGAPDELAASADATFGTYDLCAHAITHNGAAIETCARRVGVESEGSHHTEGVASVRCSDRVIYFRNIFTALGVPPEGPTVLLTDSRSNNLVANAAGSSTRSRHYLRMYHRLQQRIASREVSVKHVSDRDMPSDVLTKYVDKGKFERCVAYLTGMRSTPS